MWLYLLFSFSEVPAFDSSFLVSQNDNIEDILVILLYLIISLSRVYLSDLTKTVYNGSCFCLLLCDFTSVCNYFITVTGKSIIRYFRIVSTFQCNIVIFICFYKYGILIEVI